MWYEVVREREEEESCPVMTVQTSELWNNDNAQSVGNNCLPLALNGRFNTIRNYVPILPVQWQIILQFLIQKCF